MTLEVSGSKHVSYPSLMAMGICHQGSLSGGELGREIPSAVRGTVQLPFFLIIHSHITRWSCLKKIFSLPVLNPNKGDGSCNNESYKRAHIFISLRAS
ncbi:hypothetical protein Hanom_Chr08g00740241 [Helianthus anomalus]